MKTTTIIILIILIPIGFYTKFYHGPFYYWVNNSLGGILYEIFWCLALLLFLPKTRPYKIALGVFIITSTLEILQLWHPTFLMQIRRTFIGRTLIGTSFVWSDFFYYSIGCIIGFLLLRMLQRGKYTST